MPNGVYTWAGLDNDGDDIIDVVISGTWTVTESGNPSDDDNILTVGEAFSISLEGGGPNTQNLAFFFTGPAGSGVDSPTGLRDPNGPAAGGQVVLSDSEILVGDSFPTTVNEPLPICFAAGTLIDTPSGEKAVETLEIGDLVTTADGRAVPVKWIGRQTLHKLFTPAERLCPVRVRAGALGNGLPHTDLVLTADHALILDGLAINAGALVNGTTIAYEPVESLPDRVTYYHVETEDHEIILANGAPAETYVDYVQRAAFDNHAEYLALYGEDRTITEMDLPRVSAARLVPPALRRRLGGDRAA